MRGSMPLELFKQFSNTVCKKGREGGEGERVGGGGGEGGS